MRAFAGAFKRLPSAARAAQQQARSGAVAEASESVTLVSGMGLQNGNAARAMQQERCFSLLRVRPASTAWQQQQSSTATLSSTGQAMAAAAAWAASVNYSESGMVEDWLTALHQIDSEARAITSGLLSRHPTLLYKDPQRFASVVQALLDSTRQKHLLRPWFMQDTHVMAIADRYTPDALRARLSELHRLVWQRVDDPNVAAVFASRTSLDMLDLDAKALALKARALRSLIPEFLPSTILRGCPELLDVQVDDLPAYVHRAGNVVVIGERSDVTLEHVALNDVVIVRSKGRSSSPSASSVGPFATPAAVPQGGRLLRTARCGAQALLSEQTMQSRDSTASDEVVRVFCNTRQLVFACGDSADVRVVDPNKAQEEMTSACRMAVHTQLSPSALTASGVGGA